MPNLIRVDDFSSGWCPADDPINGRKNGLRKMESVTLDSNGALTLSQGTTRVLAAFTNALHSLYHKFISGTGYYYSADTAGVVFRNSTSIATGGSVVRAAFNAAYNYVFVFSGDKRVRDDGAATVNLGVVKPSTAPTLASGGAGILTGDYQYAQINVYTNDSYQAKSARGLIGSITVATEQVTVTPQDPAAVGSIANEAWIFRRGVNLDQWYRIARVTTFGSFTDNTSDDDVLALDITMNDFLLSVNSTDTPDAILACVGPVYGRMIYFTAKNFFLSDIASPDSYDARNVFGLGGSSGSETFLWAIKVSRNLVMVGTDRDVYSLLGTFIQLPDGFLDVTLDPLAVDNPPIGIDVALYGNAIVYMSKSGWVVCGTNGVTVPLTFPNTTNLYSGLSNAEYSPANINVPLSIRYPCCISNNKLFTKVTSTLPSTRMEMYDFLRKYWRVVELNPVVLFTAENNRVLGFDNDDKFIKVYENPTTKLIDNGSMGLQTVDILTQFLDDGHPRNKKDLYTLTIQGFTASDTIGLAVSVAFDGGATFTAIGTFASLLYSEVSFDISGAALFPSNDPGVLAKNIQVRLTGSVLDLNITAINISYDARPQSELHLNVQDLGLDSVNKKRVRVLSCIINTNVADLDFYPVIDGVVQPKSTFNTTKKRTVSHYFLTDVFGIDYTGFFVGTELFEFYKFLAPSVVQILPEGKKLDQVGPTELARYGKIKEMEIRLTAFGGTLLPYTIYFEDAPAQINTLDVLDGIEGVYHIGIPKTVAGSIVRIVFGPTSYLFHRAYTRIKVAKSGQDTEEKWVTLEEGNIG